MRNTLVSIVLLTYNRPLEIGRNVRELLNIRNVDFELIVVDNCSENSILEHLPNDCRLRVIRTEENIGAAGRNLGILASKGELIVTLDDDVFGFCQQHIWHLFTVFEKDLELSSVCFKVIDDVDEAPVNWVHHRAIEHFENRSFDTYEISEGAVAFRKSYLDKTDLYPAYFFISHEGPDLALQLIKTGGRIRYDPKIVVRHSHSESGRLTWRRYYYDTRNQIWLLARHYPIRLGLSKLFLGLGSMFFYSLRDGFLKYYIKGVYDGFKGLEKPLRERVVILGEPRCYLKSMMKKNPSILYMLKKRAFSNKVRI